MAVTKHKFGEELLDSVKAESSTKILRLKNMLETKNLEVKNLKVTKLDIKITDTSYV